MRICCVCGARPNFMKIAAVVEAFRARPELETAIVHTGQHYDSKLSKAIFDDLGLPRPDVDLEVGSASHVVQTAEIMKRFEPVVEELRPDLVLVVGDVNSTVACSLVATKLGIAVAHVEAGLRSFDRSMPEEINRIVTDALSHLLFVSEESGMVNLRREGVPEDNLFFVGNVMIDTLLRHRERAEASQILRELALEPGGYAVLTLHRPSNVDDPEVFGRLAGSFSEIGRELPVVFPVHPRTRARLDAHPVLAEAEAAGAVRLVDPLAYLDFLKLMAEASVVLTDSGGIQEETTILQVPCLTLRENTERPATVTAGLNSVVGTDPRAILDAFRAARGGARSASPPEGWDGRAGERIAAALAGLDRESLERLVAGRTVVAAGGLGAAAVAASR